MLDVKNSVFSFGDSKLIPHNIVGIYCIYNSTYCYVGQSLDISQRTRHHYNCCNSGRHCNEYLQRVYKKHPEDTFFVKILEIVEDHSLLLDREKYWIDYYKNCGNFICTNIADPVIVYSHCERSHKKPVYQFDNSGILLHKWKGIADASRHTGISKALISSCVRNKSKHGGGYIWSYEQAIDADDYRCVRSSTGVNQFDLDGNFVTTWNSIVEAAKENLCDSYRISLCCYRNIPSTYGYIWRDFGDVVTESDIVLAKKQSDARCSVYDLNGNFIKMCDTCKTASVEFKVTLRNIYACCARKAYRAKDYIFRYEGDSVLIDDLWNLECASGRPVWQIKDGVILNGFSSAVDAGKAINSSGNVVRTCCIKHLPLKGFEWRFMTKEEWLKYKKYA